MLHIGTVFVLLFTGGARVQDVFEIFFCKLHISF